jgi:hypothetical protein
LIGQFINANLYYYGSKTLILNEKNLKKEDFQTIVDTSNKVMNDLKVSSQMRLRIIAYFNTIKIAKEK